MSTYTFIGTLPNKQIVSIVVTDSGRFVNISNRKIKTDGLIQKAVEVSASYVALELVRQIEENNRILVPPSIQEYPYEPILV